MTTKTLTYKAVVLGSLIYMVSNNFVKEIEDALSKKHITKLMNGIKENLAINRGQNEEEYKKLLNTTLELIDEIKDELKIDEVKLDPILSPTDLVLYLNFRYKDILEELGIDNGMVASLRSAFTPTGCSLNNVVFVNRLLESLEKRYENA